MRRIDDLPPGFGLYRSDTSLFGSNLDLLVPVPLLEEIEAARLAKSALDHREEEQKESRTPAHSRPSLASSLDQKIHEEQAALESEPDDENRPECGYPVFERTEPLRMLRNVQEATPDRDRHAQIQRLHSKLKGLGRYRSVTGGELCHDGLRALDRSHPHFREVTQLVRERLLLSDETHRPPQIPPILLLGPAGVGKTHFSKALADAIGTTFCEMHFDTALTDSALLGSEKRWGNTSYGLLFEQICLGDSANPVILLDELDKAPADRRHDPLAPLHGLLEPVSARTVTDISVDFTFDASLVIWIATANNPLRIPQTLRSRFRQFVIDFPKAEHSIQIAAEVARSVVERIAPAGFAPPSREIGVLLGHLTAREAHQATSDAVARAVAAGRLQLERGDFSAEVLLEDDNASGWLH